MARVYWPGIPLPGAARSAPAARSRSITSRHDQPLLQPPLVLQPGDGQPSHSRSAQPPAGTGATRAAHAALLRWAPGAGRAPARSARPSRPAGVQAGIPRGDRAPGAGRSCAGPRSGHGCGGASKRERGSPRLGSAQPAPNRLDLTKMATHRRTKLLKVPVQGRSTATPAQRLSSAPGETPRLLPTQLARCWVVC